MRLAVAADGCGPMKPKNETVSGYQFAFWLRYSAAWTFGRMLSDKQLAYWKATTSEHQPFLCL